MRLLVDGGDVAPLPRRHVMGGHVLSLLGQLGMMVVVVAIHAFY